MKGRGGGRKEARSREEGSEKHTETEGGLLFPSVHPAVAFIVIYLFPPF